MAHQNYLNSPPRSNQLALALCASDSIHGVYPASLGENHHIKTNLMRMPQVGHHATPVAANLGGQLGLGQIVTEVRRTYVAPAPPRVQYNSIYDCLTEGSYQSIITPTPSSCEFAITEILTTTTTKFATPIATVATTSNSLDHPNDNVDFNLGVQCQIPTTMSKQLMNYPLINSSFANQTSLPFSSTIGVNQYPFTTNQANRSLAQMEAPYNAANYYAANYYYESNSQTYPTASIWEVDHDKGKQFVKDGSLVSYPEPVRILYAPTRTTAGGNLRDEEPNRFPRYRQSQNVGLVNFPSRSISDKSIMNLVEDQEADDPQGLVVENFDCEVGDYEFGRDGRTHSLPHKKYGPYTCPRCKREFSISQTFAAHMLSHYKYETPDQRRRRLTAKYKKKHLRFYQSRSGMTLLSASARVPMKIYPKIHNKGMRKKQMAGVTVAGKVEVQESRHAAAECGYATDASNAPVSMVVKKESIV